MPLDFFSTKIIAGVLAGSVTLGAVGLTFNGSETIDSVKTQLESMKSKIVAYENSENSLFEKIGLIKQDATDKLTFANTKITDAKNEINNLKAEKSFLTTSLAKVTAERDAAIQERDQLSTDLESANNMINDLEATITHLTEELETVISKLEDLETKYNLLLEQYNALVAENDTLKEEANRANAEVQKANDKVAELEEKSNEVEAETSANEPMTTEELDNIGTEVSPDVFDAELVVKNLNLTYIQNGQSEEFKAQHPDLDIKEGDRVWRITNNNDFKVYVEYNFTGNGNKSELIANPSQTFYLTETGGTMIIKWQDENGV
ncbi:hypothetical protein Q75_15730 [Bacillus coahuilensis p1.1.43]|uniref:Uncharacterized protein n=1 Tax=Bacillus coahuilensis p1.1.43 TaxID=1150625 RepID=A0A147K4Q9_9BACI|nr:hypothetical protein [Bacillus coahuilensis]KUP04437.1 hypothetical protein Q75_15730 [Bacillus coahuilensis p1.1.43]